MYQNLKKLLILLEYLLIALYLLLIQVAYVMESEETITEEFSAFSPIKDASPKYVLSLDTIDMSRNGITHLNIIDFLTHKKDLFLF